MSEKVYSIASPSICTKEKSHVVVVGSGPDRNEKVYSFSITPANTENKNDVDYPICIAPYARYKAVKEDNAGVTATKVKAKGILTDVVENALRQIEVEAYISNTTDFDLNRNINVANIEMQHSQRMDNIFVQLISAEASPQHRRIFDINHIEGVESTKPSEIEAMVHASDVTNLITNEYEVAPIIKQDLLKGKLREFAAGVEVLPEWVNVARIVYGECFYNDLMADRVTTDYEAVSMHNETSDIVTRELKATHAEVTLSTAVPNIYPVSIVENETGDIQQKEILLHAPVQFEFGTKEREVKGIIEEFDLFNGMGIPVYLPDYDLFARMQRDIETSIATQYVSNRLEEIESVNLLPYENIESAYLIRDINVKQINLDHSIRTIELGADVIASNEVSKKINVFDTERNEAASFTRTKEQYANVDTTHAFERIVETLDSIYADQQEIANKENVFTAAVEVRQEVKNASRVLSVKDISGTDDANKSQNIFEIQTIVAEEAERLHEINAGITTADYSHRILKELQGVSPDVTFAEVKNELQATVVELDQADIEGTAVLTHVDEISSFGLKERLIITHVDTNEVANKTEKEFQANIEEFDLFEGLGIPVYLPEFDLFGRVQKELETRISLFNNSSKSLNVMQMKLDQTIESEKAIKEHTTAVIEEVASDIVPVILDTEHISLDISYKQDTQQALITEQEAFTGIREFESGIISDITPADKEVITRDTNVIETVDAARESERYAIVSEQELLERQAIVDAVTNEVDTFDRGHELESVAEEYEQFERMPERESVLEDNERFKMARVLDTEKPDELLVIEKENNDPKLWLRHSRQSWWTNSNWKKTR
ncbi:MULTISPECIES: hypothetical protein [Bacillus cereus group]|uniref:hypothetical protein n=1 Tax=Bacillus cereus group TaxID=86661 RepID=UPI000BEF5C2E|nr:MULTISPECIES: hypothetical protein [Bacillus cereus group]MBJ7933074.1 hypothetical protein [Bacillus cereus group sp. N31]PEK05383.1 hypothetical protein CN681_30515 [Bacillus toyonensis]PEM22120.1 hypothetical protein CN616_00370 [Bacillus toyonensis]PGA47051.1 hypothetical protein COL85_05170 [Bacillus toyonensis]PGA51226.1 hypothetical protein COL86_27580 [Bacillus toyonensis]